MVGIGSFNNLKMEIRKVTIIAETDGIIECELKSTVPKQVSDDLLKALIEWKERWTASVKEIETFLEKVQNLNNEK